MDIYKPQKLKPSYIKHMVKTSFPDLVEVHGFQFYKPDILLRLKGLILHVFAFQRSEGAFWTIPAIQLLLAQERTIHYALGDRLAWEKDGQPFGAILVEDEEQERLAVKIIRHQLDNIILPYHYDSDSLETLASDEYRRKYERFWSNTFWRDVYLLHIYAFLGRKAEYIQLFEEVMEWLRQDDLKLGKMLGGWSRPQWEIDEINRLKLMRENLDNRNALDDIFRCNIQYSIDTLKLHKFITEEWRKQYLPGG